jgi:HK97 gp10 family phage protein
MFQTKFSWSIDPAQAVQKLDAGIRNKAMRIALNAAAAPVKAAVISSAPKGEGHLAASTKIKVTNYRNKAIWVAVVGAGGKYKRLKKRKVRGKNGKTKTVTVKGKNGDRKYVRPATYQAFVDRGTKHSRARHYLPSAFKRSKTQFEATAKRKLGEVIEQLLGQKSRR